MRETHAIRVCGREAHAHRAALGDTEEVRPLDAARIHHGPDVVHPLGERDIACDRIGQAGAALVEHREPRERGEPMQVSREIGPLPGGFDVRDEAGNRHEIRRPLTDHLEGDVESGALRVPRLRCHRVNLATC